MSRLHPGRIAYRVSGTTTAAAEAATQPAAGSPGESRSQASPEVVHTATFAVHYENPRAHKGYRKELYDSAKKWCPSMTIRVSGSQMRTATGAASVAYTWMSQRQVVVRPGLSSFDYWGIMPHECAHIHQGDAYTNRTTGTLNYSALQHAMARIYGGGLALGLEYNADCTASVWFGQHQSGNYGGPCSSRAQIRAAKLIGRGEQV